MRNILVLFILFSGCLGAFSTFAQENISNEENVSQIERRIHVSGTGVVEIVPDEANLQFGVSTQDKSAKKAMNDASNRMQQIMEVLASNGVEESNIQTSELNVATRYDYEKGKVEGYVVNSILGVKIDDLTLLPDLLEGLSEAGMNELNAMEFASSQQKELENQALELAVQDAKARADIAASAAGVSVGAPIEINMETSASPMREFAVVADAKMASGNAMPVAAGTMEIRTNVNISYELEAD